MVYYSVIVWNNTTLYEQLAIQPSKSLWNPQLQIIKAYNRMYKMEKACKIVLLHC